ncbi:signal recognition particle 72 kDa protein [Babesia ovata]|uniref:Signal recognition particle subunit SRP72 n=1 Tax=Babesia ovata TaxID=189622 RepID=A0A2H6KGT5_9APIC|nr:signal recognition particle 72 kDa protein [Babesia ovata]GBE62194.1 signal recognition particle 72 kDa protein [Babesia ovata]
MAGKSAYTGSAETALREVKQLIDEGQLAQASRLCHKAIRVHGGVNELYRAKCYCDIQLSRWQSCLDTVGWLHLFVEHPSIGGSGNKRCPKRLRTETRQRREEQHADRLEAVRGAAGTHIANGECQWLHFEQAYSYYKLGDPERALIALRMCSSEERPRALNKSNAGSDSAAASDADVHLDETLSPKYRFLLAQVYVRLGRYSAARALYTSALAANDDPLVALNALSTDLNLVPELDEASRNSIFEGIERGITEKAGAGDSLGYEYFYNWAIAKLLEGDFESSQEHLDVSEERLTAELQNDLGEKNASKDQPEYAALGAMRVFLLHRRGCQDLARGRSDALLDSFDAKEGVDPGVILILLNNALCLCGEDADTSNLMSKMELLLKRANVVCKFTRRELLDVHRNIVLRLLASGDINGCRRHLLKFMGRLRNDVNLHNCLACAEYVEGKIDCSINALKRGLAAHPDSIMLIRSLLNVLVATRRFKSALHTAQAYESTLSGAGASGFYWWVLMQCHINMSNRQGVVEVLSRLVERGDCEETTSALQQGCRFLESQGMHSEAVQISRHLHASNPDNTAAFCGALFNESFLPGAAGATQCTLPASFTGSLFKELRYIDPEDLEAEGTLSYVRQVEEVRKSSKSRKRRRAPKVDTSRGPPDPERWLPKYQRAAFKKQLKRKKDMHKGQTQGSTGTAASNKPTSVTISTETSNIRFALVIHHVIHLQAPPQQEEVIAT